MSGKYWIIGILLLTIVAMASEYNPRPRFEKLLSERLPQDGITNVYSLTVFHDKETGQEFICASGGGYQAISCFPTGRNWKN